ncbi:hypothetical protein Nepgr_029619 [Nepenthes gracilis]|uniref:C2H2-type domain-containing protein n=1 Tax=Nepenthes gracilis TaxID=150966 RepID=A0AAD3TEM5_NEPGR|nr:hypothetical protein Nepgr_029619 [Nepenthes gracilis]
MDSHRLQGQFQLPGKDDHDDRLQMDSSIPVQLEGEEEKEHKECFGFAETLEEKLLIRLKEQESTSGSRRCSICDKRFNSGKALGGHMRIHVPYRKFKEDRYFLEKIQKRPRKREFKIQNHRNPKLKKLVASSNDLNDLMQNGKPTCSLCNKSFPSMKSLFGHMRCHPEREWRGMLPPPLMRLTAARNSSCSNVSDALPRKADDQNDSATNPSTSTSGSAINLLQSMPGWSVTAKRCRRSLISDASGSVSALEEGNQIQDVAAVCSLMLLACGNSRDFNPSPSYCDQSAVETSTNWKPNSDEIGDKDTLCDYYTSSKMRKPKTKPTAIGSKWYLPSKKLRMDERDNMETLVGKNERDDSGSYEFVLDKSTDNNQGHKKESEEAEDEDGDEMNESGKKRRKRRMIKLRNLQLQESPTVGGDGKYSCSTCNKCFPTYQALGGHRSSHHKISTSFKLEESSSALAAEEEHIVKEAVAASLSGAEVTTTAVATSTVCNKSLPSGEALGGHKRCDWTGQAESSAAASSPGNLDSETGRRVLGFDLNELPAMED